MRQKKGLVVFLSLLLLLCMFPVSSQAELRFMEMDEQSEAGYRVLSGVTINARSPLRVSDVGTNSDYDPTITAPYNEPRSKSHEGVDLHSRDASGNGRPVFSVYGNGTVYQIQPNLNTSTYGRYVLVQHRATVNSTDYYFQSFYAHLSSVSVTSTTSVTDTTRIGVSGGSGLTETSYPVHLHLEFRGASATKSNTMRRYPPTPFYTHKGSAYANKMVFIARTAASSSSVTFQIQSVYNGAVRKSPPDRVWLYYKNGGMSSWASTSMNVAADGITFTKDLTSLYGSSNTLSYYVRAENNSYDGSTYYTAFRPWRYNDGTAPTDRPFTVSRSSLYTASKDLQSYATSSEPMVNAKPDVINTKSYDLYETIQLVKQIDEESWEVSTLSGTTYTMVVKFKNAAPTLLIGEKYAISANYADTGENVIIVEGDWIRSLQEIR